MTSGHILPGNTDVPKAILSRHLELKRQGRSGILTGLRAIESRDLEMLRGATDGHKFLAARSTSRWRPDAVPAPTVGKARPETGVPWIDRP